LTEPRLRVLIFCQLFPPLIYGGGEVLFWNLAKSLASRGNQVHVITQRVRGEKDREIKCGVSIRRVGRPAEYAGALTTNFGESLAYFVGALLAGIQHISRSGVDIIHSNTYVPALVGQICATLFGRKHVATVHDVYLISMSWFWEKWSRQRGLGLSARFLGPFLERTILQLPVDVIHTVSETSKQDLISMGVERDIIVVPNGIDPADYEIEASSSANHHQAIYIGRLVFYKNLEPIFRAFSKIIRDVPDARLSLVGDGPMRAPWENVVGQLGLRGHVEFHGRTSSQEKIRLLRESACLILPSFVEGFGIVILEAFACDRPVLASDIGALRELVANDVDGYLLNPSSEEDWAKRMIYLFGNPSRARELGNRGRRKLEARYSIVHVAERMERLYEGCLAKTEYDK
jgi:glycosyltransferase involved in cell wall biosynthesis